MTKTYTYEELQQHRTPDSCWVVLYGNVYDVTQFLPKHPGGAKIILQLAGSDATEEYDPVHPPGTLEENLASETKLGSFDSSTLPATLKPDAPQTNSSKAETPEQDGEPLMTIEECLNLDDIEALATRKISRKAWGYYYSAGDDLLSKRLNNTVYSEILLRPRVFIDVTKCDLSTSMLGNRVDVPFFVSPAAMARLGHPDGEHGIAQACAKHGVPQIISNNASQSPEQIVADSAPGQIFGWQLYVQNERQKSIEMLARIAKLPQIKFVVLTLDAAVPGKREHDERSQNVGAKLPVASSVAHQAPTSDAEGIKIDGAGGVGKALFSGTAADLTWQTTLPWLAQHTRLPIILKGIQTHEDAYIASQHHSYVKGIILSNHGGRAADTAPPSIHTLLEIRRFCPQVLSQLEVYVDGGIRRGTDVVKAVALGARAVGLGRAPLFGNGAAGQKGVERVFEILKAEVDTAMRLLGVGTVAELRPHHVNARRVERDIYDGPEAINRGMWAKSRL